MRTVPRAFEVAARRSSRIRSVEVVDGPSPYVVGRRVPEPDAALVGGFAHASRRRRGCEAPSLPERIVSPFANRAQGILQAPTRPRARHDRQLAGDRTDRGSWPQEPASNVIEARQRSMRSLRGIYALVRLHGQRGPALPIALRAIDDALIAVKAAMPYPEGSSSPENSDRSESPTPDRRSGESLRPPSQPAVELPVLPERSAA